MELISDLNVNVVVLNMLSFSPHFQKQQSTLYRESIVS